MRSRSLSLLAAIAVLGMAACTPPAPAKQGSAADEQAIRDLAGKYAAAFNAHDSKAMGALMATDYEEVDPMGKHTQGRDAAEANMTAMWPQMPADMKMTATTTFVKWIDANHATAAGTYQMAGTPAGMPNHGAWIGVAVKQDSTWVMSSSLGADAPPDMPAPAKPKGK